MRMMCGCFEYMALEAMYNNKSLLLGDLILAVAMICSVKNNILSLLNLWNKWQVGMSGVSSQHHTRTLVLGQIK